MSSRSADAVAPNLDATGDDDDDDDETLVKDI